MSTYISEETKTAVTQILQEEREIAFQRVLNSLKALSENQITVSDSSWIRCKKKFTIFFVYTVLQQQKVVQKSYVSLEYIDAAIVELEWGLPEKAIELLTIELEEAIKLFGLSALSSDPRAVRARKLLKELKEAAKSSDE